MQRFASAYKEQQEFEALQADALNDYLQLQSFVVTGFDPAHVRAQDAQAALPIVRQALAHLGGTESVLDGTVKAYGAALGGA